MRFGVVGAEYFKQLYMAEPPSSQLSLAGVQMASADPLLVETPPSLTEVREVVSKLKCCKAAGVCNTIVCLLNLLGPFSA